MKKLILFTLCIFAFSFSGEAQIRFGAGASYTSSSGFNQLGLQAKGYLGVSEAIDLSPAFTLWLGDGADWTLDVDAQYKLLSIGESFDFFPFAGLNIVSGGSDTNVAINLGASFQLELSSGSQIYIEPKFIVIDNSAFVVSAGYLF